MAKIHIPGDGHVVPLPSMLPSGATIQWLAVSDPKQKKVISDALHILTHNVKGVKPCNDCFKNLPNGRTFDDLLNDAAIFISVDPSNDVNLFGAALGNDITITNSCIRKGRWTVAATLVHELAHVNGAPGNDHQAEGTLLCCGFKKLHDVTIIGSRDGNSGTRLV